MTNYVLIYSGGGMPEDEAEQAKIMKAWMTWYENLGSAVVDLGGPFGPQAKIIAPDLSVSEPPMETSPSGYSIFKADSLDDAVEMAKGCPIFKDGGEILVRETFSPM